MKIARPSTCFLVFYFVVNVCNTSAKHERAMRIRRQDPGDKFIDAIFGIPIQTLTAVGTVVKTSRPVIMNVRQRIQQSLTSPSLQRPPRSQWISLSSSNRRQAQTPTDSFNRLYKPDSQPHRFSSSASASANRRHWRRR